ncbi:MAG: ASCH domain-containing protein [Actinomycetaceae bacterium]
MDGLPAVDVVPLGEVPAAHARAEGEGYESVDEWRRVHVEFWSSEEMRAERGEGFSVVDDTLVVLERFAVVDPR